jgi:hypothetical protein
MSLVFLLNIGPFVLYDHCVCVCVCVCVNTEMLIEELNIMKVIVKLSL